MTNSNYEVVFEVEHKPYFLFLSIAFLDKSLYNLFIAVILRAEKIKLEKHKLIQIKYSLIPEVSEMKSNMIIIKPPIQVKVRLLKIIVSKLLLKLKDLYNLLIMAIEKINMGIPNAAQMTINTG